MIENLKSTTYVYYTFGKATGYMSNVQNRCIFTPIIITQLNYFDDAVYSI